MSILNAVRAHLALATVEPKQVPHDNQSLFSYLKRDPALRSFNVTLEGSLIKILQQNSQTKQRVNIAAAPGEPGYARLYHYLNKRQGLVLSGSATTRYSDFKQIVEFIVKSLPNTALATVEPAGNPVEDFFLHITNKVPVPGPFGLGLSHPGFNTHHWGFLCVNQHDRNNRGELHLVGKYGGHVFLDSSGLTLGQDADEDDAEMETKHVFNSAQVRQHSKGETTEQRFDNLLTAALRAARWIR